MRRLRHASPHLLLFAYALLVLGAILAVGGLPRL
jgi:hypothetical protein